MSGARRSCMEMAMHPHFIARSSSQLLSGRSRRRKRRSSDRNPHSVNPSGGRSWGVGGLESGHRRPSEDSSRNT